MTVRLPARGPNGPGRFGDAGAAAAHYAPTCLRCATPFLSVRLGLSHDLGELVSMTAEIGGVAVVKGEKAGTCAGCGAAIVLKDHLPWQRVPAPPK